MKLIVGNLFFNPDTLFGTLSITDSHALAKQVADAGQITADSQTFKDLTDELRDVAIPGGALFKDKTSMVHFEGMYNFKNQIQAVDLIAGANFRRFSLNSGGILFALDDNGDEINYSEYGAYAQVGKALAQDKLRLQASVRYDKNENFAGQFSPRISAVTTVANDHNFRLSFQRGFRIPTAQDQFIDLDVVSRRLVGSNPLLIERYNWESNTVYSAGSVTDARTSFAQSGDATAAAALLDPIEFKEFKTEKVSTFEVGYKGLIAEKLFFDTYYYYSSYQDFIAEILFIQTVLGGTTPNTGPADPEGIVSGSVETQEFGFDTNADGNVTSHGWAAGLDYSLPRGFRLNGNISWNKLIDQQDLIDQGFRSSYNTPEWRTNITFSNREVIDNLGFNITYRWQDAFFWEASFGAGVIPSFGTLDAQVSYKVPSIKSILKLGAQNLLDEKYTTGFGNPTLGAMYYLSITFDEFLN